MDIRVAIFEDNKIMRDAFEAICNGTEGLTCSGVFADGNDFYHKIERSLPDVILMDIEIPGNDGITITRKVSERWPGIKILIQTVFEDDEKIFKAICFGASGYILKSTSPARLVDSIYEVYKGGAPMTPAIANRVLKLFQKMVPLPPDEISDYALSSREKEILSLLIVGKSLRTIAETLFVSYETVRFHVKSIYRKLHVNSSSEAIVKAINQRLV